jgi:hypothetical protein
MTDELELLGELPRHRPSDALRREVGRLALERLRARRPRWRRFSDELAIPLALAAASLIYLAWAAEHTPLLR